MSCIYKGSVIETKLSQNSFGGTEQMRSRLLVGVDNLLLSKVAIHFSRPRTIYRDVPNILYCHDTTEDPENSILKNNGWQNFDKFVFVSCWQRDQYVAMFGIPYSKCIVIENAIEPANDIDKSSDQLRLIYHTTPHRGLELLYPIYDAISKEMGSKMHLDVFSSFELYGWKSRDKNYEVLFKNLQAHEHITYHGYKPNSVIRDYLAKAHYFPYPCIWKETSCIALIEAMEHGVVAIHPNYGALPETAGTNTFMYDYSENLNEHATRFYQTLKIVLDNNLGKYKQINKNIKHNINCFNSKWNNILKAYA